MIFQSLLFNFVGREVICNVDIVCEGMEAQECVGRVRALLPAYATQLVPSAAAVAGPAAAQRI